MINKTLITLLFFSFILPKETDLRKNFQISKQNQNCEQIKSNSDLFWFFNDMLPENNYSLHFKYLYCKYLSDTLNNSEMQSLSIFGMYQEIESISEDAYLANKDKALTTIQIQENQLQNIDSFIKENAEQKVVIYNDDHSRMETRAFFLSKLGLYKELGFTHLAMEAFQDINETLPSFKLGYYFQEPIMAEIYREAKRLGYKLVQYESFDDDRLKGQAYNLYNQIKALKENEKMLVFSGQTNLAEDVPETIQLLGTILKNDYKIDPLTIDQTRGINSAQAVDVIFNKATSKTKSGILSSKIIREKIGFGFVDYFYIHPEYKYEYGRPEWLKCGNIRKHYPYKCKNTNAVLIQVYYDNELTKDNSINYITPADMIYKLDKKRFAHLYLKPNNSYTVIYRDRNNKIIYKDKIYFF